MNPELPNVIEANQRKVITLLQEKDAIVVSLTAARDRNDAEAVDRNKEALRKVQDSIAPAMAQLKSDLTEQPPNIRLLAAQNFRRLMLAALGEIDAKVSELQEKQREAMEAAGELRTKIASLEAVRDSATAFAEVRDLTNQIRKAAGELESVEQFERNLTRKVECIVTAAADWRKTVESSTRVVWQAEFDRRRAELSATGFSLAHAWVAFKKAGAPGFTFPSYENFLTTLTGPVPDGELIVTATRDLETALGLAKA